MRKQSKNIYNLNHKKNEKEPFLIYIDDKKANIWLSIYFFILL